MPLVFNNPGHWNQRAVEARQMADRMIGPCARERMLAVAAQYDLVAERAVKRLKAQARGSSALVEGES
jgi:hypothetical protein